VVEEHVEEETPDEKEILNAEFRGNEQLEARV
jgi:hypothetical protein